MHLQAASVVTQWCCGHAVLDGDACGAVRLCYHVVAALQCWMGMRVVLCRCAAVSLQPCSAKLPPLPQSHTCFPTKRCLNRPKLFWEPG